MRSRRTAILALGALSLAPREVFAQLRAAKIYRVGFLGTAFEAGYTREIEWIRGGLRKFGYEEGKNIAVEYRWGEGDSDRIRKIAAEFVALRVDVIVAHNVIGATAASRQTATIPIVMVDGSDPVAAGLAVSLARPGRNVTGSTSFVPEEGAKRLEILREVAPRAKRIALLSSEQYPAATMAAVRKAIRSTAASLKVEVLDFVTRDEKELPEVFRAIGKAELDGLVVNNEPLLNSQASVIAALASLTRLPSIGYPNFADSGGLLAYGASRPALYGRAGYFLDLIFKGAKPSEIPFEQAAKFDLIVNLKTAGALGIAVPPSLRLRADRVVG